MDFHVVDLMVAAVPAKKKYPAKKTTKKKCPPCTKRCATKNTNALSKCQLASTLPRPCSSKASSEAMRIEVREELRRTLRARAERVN